MKLEMRYGGLDIRFEMDDQETYNALEVIQNLKNLLSELSDYDKVSLVVASIPEEDHDSDEELDDEEDSEAV
ncbi:hypothetical protein EB118_25945 [bacterium]|nr:hypothetical protein [bacterium]